MSTTHVHPTDGDDAVACGALAARLTDATRVLQRLVLRRRLSRLDATIAHTARAARRAALRGSYLEFERRHHACESWCIERACLRARLDCIAPGCRAQ